MASCQTWSAATSHIRHPWFDTTIMKRKHRDSVSPDDELDPVSAPRKPLPKRRRISALERGFAQMSIGFSDLADIPVVPVDPPPPATPMDADMLPASSSSTYPAASPPVHQIPYTVEEPVAPEVKMKTSSWYEPERDRIVITDMDSFTEEDEDQDGDVSINTALLDAIRSNTIDNSTTKTPPSTSQALVLFRPLPIPDMTRGEEERKREQEAVEIKDEGPVDDDAMDIED